MTAGCIAEAISAVSKNFVIELADNDHLLRKAFELRYQVYCLERGFEPGVGGLEKDEFDSNARHVLLRRRDTREVLGTVRVVLPRPEAPHASFPMQQVCAPAALAGLPLHRMAEISRFALSKERRIAGGTPEGLLRLGLVQGIVRVSAEEGLTHWCAVMEPSLLRLLRTSSIYFQAAGPLVEHHGLRQPAFCDVGDMLGRMQHERTMIWDFITDGGRLWPNTAPLQLAA